MSEESNASSAEARRPSASTSSPVSGERASLARRLALAIATPVVLLALLGVVLGAQIVEMSDDARWVDHTDEVIATASETLKQIVDEETALRGYLISGDRTFLEPFERAHPTDGFDRLHDLVADNPPQQARFLEARRAYERWSASVVPVIDAPVLDRTNGASAMLARKNEMDAIRETMRAATETEENLRRERAMSAQASTTRTKYLFVGLFGASAIVLAFLSRRQLKAIAETFAAAFDAEARARRDVEEEAWIRAGVAEVVGAVQGDNTVHTIGAEALKALAARMGADVGAFFTRDGNVWRRRAGFALDPGAAGPETFGDGEGLVGRAAKDTKIVHVKDVPAEGLTIKGGTGGAAAAELVLVPARIDGSANAVLELGFLRRCPARALELASRVGESLSLAVRSAETKDQLRSLLEETQRQAEELQSQQEELRVANEELETQTVALKKAQRELEGQQAELEQTNYSLTEQREELEEQNRALAESQTEVAAKAREVERASQFKSEFLSNMSHELRTPLNSSLIMAKLLADNKDGNLTAEQIKFAETIYSAGNDLLALINDVLDLAKIEAGKFDVNPGNVAVDRVRTNLLRTFEPVAKEKKLRFAVTVREGTSATFETDMLRLEQVLKNLVSNALKFTERGEVVVEVAENDGNVSFAVRDTGIGIAASQQRLVFEAFRQADATSARRYGGTGLGLSISRELARLLGGEITLESEPGRGSTFTLTLPRVFAGPRSEPTAHTAVLPASAPSSTPHEQAAENGPASERVVEPGRRIVLVVEDDEPFASVLADVAREAGFEALVASTAVEGFRLAKKHGPMGVVLDVKLPDHSGLSILDRLKRDPTTRHIPIHVISGADHREAALSMGAVAFLQKPIERARLEDALRTLEERSDHRLRRVLVVEDDKELRDSLAKLLARSDVEISAAPDAGKALALLKEHTFDCIVTDLALPGQSGFELIETMASEEPYSVPPVIVYTGRALSAEEEHRLRKHSKSIIVKGARSPERLLDEVTLFLHQVEAELPVEQRRLLEKARHRETIFTGRTVLVVEDDVRNVFALTSILEPKGAHVAIARNGKEALRALEKEARVDLVLMDVMMPEMDGLTATREIRKDRRWAKLPIIALTAKAMRDDQEKCLAAGANDYLAKPLDVEMLLSLCRVWMPKSP